MVFSVRLACGVPSSCCSPQRSSKRRSSRGQLRHPRQDHCGRLAEQFPRMRAVLVECRQLAMQIGDVLVGDRGRGEVAVKLPGRPRTFGHGAAVGSQSSSRYRLSRNAEAPASRARRVHRLA
jgi:hypothetical protein